MALNGRFIEKYGKSWDKMLPDERDMAVMSELFDLRETVEPISETCKVVARHSTYWRITIYLASAAVLTLIGVYIKSALGV